MKVSIIGTHGIPARYGGFETFAEHLALACAKAGIQVLVVNEKSNAVLPRPENVEIVSSTYNKSKSPLRFYRDSLKRALSDSDIILVCGVGGAFFYPSKKNRSCKIITNVDGLEHLRQNYTLLQRYVIYILQLLAAKKSDLLIADSNEVGGYWTHGFPEYAGKVNVIAYGADECLPFDQSILKNFRLEKNEYYYIVARLVPENNIHTILEAFKHYIGRKKLVITGDLKKTNYVAGLQNQMNENVIFTGPIYNKQVLDSLRQGCFIYLHGHSVGGTNPALLEAMAAGCACLCHDNVFNREVTGNEQMYFDSSFDLAIMLNLLEHKSTDLPAFKSKAIEKVKQDYSWKKVCNSYIELFNKMYSENSIPVNKE